MAPRPSLAIGQGREQVSGALKAEFLGARAAPKGAPGLSTFDTMVNLLETN